MIIQKFPIAIVGAGFVGMQVAQSLAQSGKDVLLIDRQGLVENLLTLCAILGREP